MLMGVHSVAASMQANDFVYLSHISYSLPSSQPDAQLSQCSRVSKARCFSHQTSAAVVFGKAITSRILSVPVSAWSDGQDRMPDLRAAEYRISGVEQEAEFLALFLFVDTQNTNTVCCISPLWIRTEPPPTSNH